MNDQTIIEGSAVDVTETAMIVAPPQQAAIVVNRGADPLRYLGQMSDQDFGEEVQIIRAGAARIGQIYKNLLRADTDYGIIPGTKNPSLLQPGAERLAMIARLVPRHAQRILTVPHAGHPDELVVHTTTYLHFESLDGPVKGTAVASTSSYEERYRWRTKERLCPKCQAPAIIKGKAEYGGGWVCWKGKKDSPGCGANFVDTDATIIGQAPGKVENDEPHALINTLVQISAKRGFVGAVRHTLGITDLFTQDVEDMPTYSREAPDAPAPSTVPAAAPKAPAASAPAPAARQAAPPMADGAATFTGPVMATPDGMRSTSKGKLVAFAIKVGGRKHNIELWGDMAVAILPHVVEGAVASVDGVYTEEDWPGRGDKPMKKVLTDVSLVRIGDLQFRPIAAPSTPTEAASEPLPFGLGAPPMELDDDDLSWGDATVKAEPTVQTGNPEGVFDQEGSVRAITWETTPKGKRYVSIQLLDPDTNSYANVAMNEADANASIGEFGKPFSIVVGERVRIMGGWSPKGATVLASVVVTA